MEDGSSEWSRDVPWRQGHVLCPQAVTTLGLQHAGPEESTCAVVISHDCDLANDDLGIEPHVEVIVGRLVAAANGNYSWGKAPRTLHLPMLCDDVPVWVELTATGKRLVPKAELANFKPDTSFVLDGKGLDVLRIWLSARYYRAAFPDSFVERMRETKVDQRIAKKLQSHGDLISFVYFDLDDGRMLERADGEPYQLSIVLVYAPGADPEESMEEAERVAHDVKDACESRLSDGKRIVLKSCLAISEDDITLSRARALTHWRLEHMSLKSDTEQLGPPVL